MYGGEGWREGVEGVDMIKIQCTDLKFLKTKKEKTLRVSKMALKKTEIL